MVHVVHSRSEEERDAHVSPRVVGSCADGLEEEVEHEGGGVEERREEEDAASVEEERARHLEGVLHHRVSEASRRVGRSVVLGVHVYVEEWVVEENVKWRIEQVVESEEEGERKGEEEERREEGEGGCEAEDPDDEEGLHHGIDTDGGLVAQTKEGRQLGGEWGEVGRGARNCRVEKEYRCVRRQPRCKDGEHKCLV